MFTRRLLRLLVFTVLVSFTALLAFSHHYVVNAVRLNHRATIDAEADAKKAFDDWMAANEKADKARKDLEAAQKALAKARAEALRDKKLSQDEAALLKNLENKVAEAQAALKAAEDQLLKARVALEKALAELPEGSKVKEELKRKRDALTSQGDRIYASNSGLRVSTFHTASGRVVLDLPDDMRAGDTISGTVLAEPNGKTDEERQTNQRELQGTVIEVTDFSFAAQPRLLRPIIAGTGVDRIPVSAGQFTLKLPIANAEIPAARINLRFILSGPGVDKVAPPWIEIKDFSFGTEKLPTSGNGNGGGAGKPSLGDFKFPKMAQPGRPLEIIGPFDGDSQNTKASLRTEGTTSGGLVPLAESPRKAVFETPPQTNGPVNIRVQDGTAQTEGRVRIVGVNLSAPKTNLLRGEKTTLTVKVVGLEGITEPVPLTLTSEGVITIDGGIYQPLVITPSQVGADGTYTTTRGITGIQAGGWAATATVVVHPFDTCLQDDNGGGSVIFDPATTDYIFLPPPNEPRSVVLPWIAQTRGALNQSNDEYRPKLSQDGCTLTLEHRGPDRQVIIRFDSCTQAGSATATAGKTKFTITDRDIRNNTCAVGEK